MVQPQVAAPRLSPEVVQGRALPNVYSPPLESGERGFVVPNPAVYSLDLPSDPHLTSQQKRAFQAISSDSSIDGMLGRFVGARRPEVPATWVQALPNSGTNVTVARRPEPVLISGGTVGLRIGLSLRPYATGTTHATIHSDVVFKRRSTCEDAPC